MIWSLLFVGLVAVVAVVKAWLLATERDRLRESVAAAGQQIACLAAEKAQLEARTPVARDRHPVRRSLDDHVADVAFAGPDVVLTDDERAAFKQLRQQFHGGDESCG